MNDESRVTILRLRKRHEPGTHRPPTAADGERLVRAQSLRYGILAGLGAATASVVLWVLVTDLLDRILPWFTLFLGALVGYAVRRGGQGFDWRFPLVAAVLTLAGALGGMVVISAGTTARELDTTTLNVLLHVTTWTWPVFFDEVLTTVEFVYGGFAAAIAAVLSLRRLDRREFQAVRLWEDGQRK